MRQLAHPGLLDDVARALAVASADPPRLVLEITESMLMEDAAAVTTLRQLKAVGVQLVIDDFGTRYSSLAYLQRFPLNVLKRSTGRSWRGWSTAASRRRSSARSSAWPGTPPADDRRGMETEDQRRRLTVLGCVRGQGFLFARPQPAAAGAPTRCAAGP